MIGRDAKIMRELQAQERSVSVRQAASFSEPIHETPSTSRDHCCVASSSRIYA